MLWNITTPPLSCPGLAATVAMGSAMVPNWTNFPKARPPPATWPCAAFPPSPPHQHHSPRTRSPQFAQRHWTRRCSYAEAAERSWNADVPVMAVWSPVFTRHNIESCARSLRVCLGAFDRRGKPIAGRLDLSAVFIHCRRICQCGHWHPASEAPTNHHRRRLPRNTRTRKQPYFGGGYGWLVPPLGQSQASPRGSLAPLENPASTPECATDHAPKNTATPGADIIAAGEYYHHY